MRNAWNLIETYNLFIIFFSACILLSCTDVKEKKIPENLLSQQQMIDIYTDMTFLDATYRTNYKEFKSYNLSAPEHIYNKYNIDSITLAENMYYYNLDFEANNEIYKQVYDNIENKKNYFDSIVKLRDSLKKMKTQKTKDLKLKDSIDF